MDIQWMKRVDRFAGIPLCGALRLYDLTLGGGHRFSGDEETAVRILQEDFSSGRRRKIGVIKFWGMGSLILAAPLFSSLRRTFPRAELHLITLQPNRGIVQLLDPADRVHYLDLSGSPARLALRILNFLSLVHEQKLDAVIDLEYLTRFSAVVSYFSGAPVRVGFHSWDVWRGNLHTIRRAFNPYWHATKNFLNLAQALSADNSPAEPVHLRLSGEEDEAAQKLLAGEGVEEGERIISVNPNASTMALARRWPEASFVALIDRITEAGLGRVVLLGAPEESAFVAEVKRRCVQSNQVVNLAGKSTLTSLVGVLRRSALLVTNDSGPLHLADALGRPTVSFFGPETPLLYGPRGQGHIVLYRGIDCSPCINIYNAKTVRCVKREPECLSGITVDQAFAAVQKALSESK